MTETKGRIAEPVQGDRVGSRIKVRGYLVAPEQGADYWLAHRRAPGGLFWPKEPKVCLDGKGAFTLTTYEGGAPGRIVLSLLMVTSAATSAAFERWLTEGDHTGGFPGMDPRDYDFRELDHVEITYDNRRPLRVFYSYSHEDEDARCELEKHLAALRRQKRIESWHDRNMTAGQQIDEEIRREIDRADIILLLISASFMASDYCYSEEMGRALRRHERGEARVVPIVVRAVDWRDSPIGNLLALPTDARPVMSWTNEDEAWADVAQGLRDVVDDLG